MTFYYKILTLNFYQTQVQIPTSVYQMLALLVTGHHLLSLSRLAAKQNMYILRCRSPSLPSWAGARVPLAHGRPPASPAPLSPPAENGREVGPQFSGACVMPEITVWGSLVRSACIAAGPYDLMRLNNYLIKTKCHQVKYMIWI